VIPIATIDSATPMPFIRSGRLRPIGTLSLERLPQIPDVPTLNEQGYKVDAIPWYGMFGPKGLPRDIVERLNVTVNRWMTLPETVEFMNQKQNQSAPKPLSIQEFERVIQADLVSWKRLIDLAGVKPE
jgi:tripartite-type tricarboxylate transporter receptor subunit TctC